MSWLELLRARLTSEEFRLLLRITRGGRDRPFGAAESEEVVDAILLRYGDEAVELLGRCDALLREEGALAVGSPPAPRPRAVEALVFAFEPGRADLSHFVSSLRRNGFSTSCIEDEAVVYVYLEASSDADFHRQREMVLALREASRLAVGGRLRGRRVHGAPPCGADEAWAKRW
jgi:hypothetical protein